GFYGRRHRRVRRLRARGGGCGVSRRVPRSGTDMLLRLGLVLIALALFGAPPARADGTVVRVAGCGDYLFVQAAAGVSVLRGDIDGVKEGDALQGNVEQIGMVSLFDQTAGRSVFAQVSELHLTQPEVTQRVAIRCRAALDATIVNGNVSRSAGCG